MGGVGGEVGRLGVDKTVQIRDGRWKMGNTYGGRWARGVGDEEVC